MSELVADYVASLCTCISAAGLGQVMTCDDGQDKVSNQDLCRGMSKL